MTKSNSNARAEVVILCSDFISQNRSGLGSEIQSRNPNAGQSLQSLNNSLQIMNISRRNPSKAKDRMGQNKNQPITFQYFKNWKQSLKISKKVNISRISIIVAEHKNGRICKIVNDRRRIGLNFILQGFRYKRSKMLFYLTPFS